MHSDTTMTPEIEFSMKTRRREGNEFGLIGLFCAAERACKGASSWKSLDPGTGVTMCEGQGQKGQGPIRYSGRVYQKEKRTQRRPSHAYHRIATAKIPGEKSRVRGAAGELSRKEQ